MIDQTISHYKTIEKLGEGGMGVVYKAQDTQLDRVVALKFLPAHASVNAETKARFLQEAKAAAALNHPNICTIYGVDESDGKMFIAMEYIEGGTLREKLPYARIDDAVVVAIQIGDALQEAHSKGIGTPGYQSRQYHADLERSGKGDGLWVGQAEGIAQAYQDLEHGRHPRLYGS